ncbi:RIP metalloprotease RseP [Methylotenera sp. G11]|uniref:RIP metalloprotease RseP n=1 Tax=Methylotenera sp. G11 TaxID=1506585 RepID=UPI00064658B9|nr:RIP metalloprotease RseP [Methylotenera sp. G11]
MLTILAFILTLGILVTVHEYGHFQVARWCGVKVLKFSVGFGKPIWSKKIGRDQTEFAIAAIPLGGYVKMLEAEQASGEDGSPAHDMSRALNQQSVAKKMAIVLAGPFANLLLAVILYWALFLTGTIGAKPYVGEVVENTPAAASQIHSGDMIQKINGKDVASWQDARWLLLNESLKSRSIEIQVIDSHQQIHLHRLMANGFSHDDANIDILEQLGLAAYQPRADARVGEVLANSPADSAGLRVGDLILSINDKKISDWEAFVQEVRLHPEKRIEVVIQRGPEQQHLSMTPDAVKENGKVIGRVGAGFKIEQSQLDRYFVIQHFTVLEALAKSLEKTWETSVFSLKMLGNMLIGNVSWKGMSGPVTIASYAGQSANMGVKVFIGFLALVSISIGILNLLPIPILDGGHFMYYMVEFFTGKPVSEAAISIGQRIGLFILGWMMVLALYNDMNRLITG